MADVVVLGGGVAGLTAAYLLARGGVDAVAVDAAAPGAATEAGAGIVSPVRSEPLTPAWQQLVVEAIAYYDELLELLTADGASTAWFRRSGQIVTSGDPAALDEVEARARAIGTACGTATIGSPVRLAPAEVAARWPGAAATVSGTLLPGVARVEGAGLLAALRAALHRHGAQVVAGTGRPVVRAGRLTGVSVDDALIEARHLVCATGAWPAPGVSSFGVTALKGEVAHLRPAAPGVAELPILSAAGGPYLVPWADGRVVAGATRHPSALGDPGVAAAGLAAVLAGAFELAPGLRAAPFVEARAGFRPVSPGGFPFVGPDRRVDGVVHVGGLGTWGLSMGPFLASCAARWVGGEAGPVLLVPSG